MGYGTSSVLDLALYILNKAFLKCSSLSFHQCDGVCSAPPMNILCLHDGHGQRHNVFGLSPSVTFLLMWYCRTSWRNCLKFATNIHVDSRINSLDCMIKSQIQRSTSLLHHNIFWLLFSTKIDCDHIWHLSGYWIGDTKIRGPLWDCAAGLKVCAEFKHFWICSFFAATSILEAPWEKAFYQSLPGAPKRG